MKKFALLCLTLAICSFSSAQWTLSYTLCDSYDGKIEWYLTDSTHYYNTGALPDSVVMFATSDLGETWQAMSRTVFTYDSEGKVLTSIFSYMGKGTWIIGTKSNFTYDANDRVVEIIDQYYSSGEWINYMRITFDYDSEGFVTLETNYTWSNDVWEPTFKTEYVNGPDGPVSSASFYYYGDWLPESTSMYTYEDGLLILQEWFDSFDENISYTEYTYDEDGNIIMEVIWDWYSSYNAWFNTDITRTYDVNGNLATEQMGHLEYQSGNSIYFNDYLCHSHYIFVDVSVAELPTQKPMIFPNPASSSLTVMAPLNSALMVYDAKGSLVINLSITPGKNNIDISCLDAGIYNMVIDNGYHNVTERVIIR